LYYFIFLHFIIEVVVDSMKRVVDLFDDAILDYLLSSSKKFNGQMSHYWNGFFMNNGFQGRGCEVSGNQASP
jgi:hypothetical protein